MDPQDLKEKALELDRMDRDVTSWEAGLLDSVLKRLRAGQSLTPKQADCLEEMHRKYFSDDEDERAAAGGDDEIEDGESGE